ncbi:HIT family protein [Deltaproteobacteria bacterium TL4]
MPGKKITTCSVIKMDDCIFCSIVEGKAPKSLVYEDDLCSVFMDLFPMSPGHVLVVPKQHQPLVQDLREDLQAHLFLIASQVRQAIQKTEIPCDGANFIINDGKAANQEVPHVHLHVVPRTKGDVFHLLGRIARKGLSGFGKKQSYEKLNEQAQQIGKYMRP